ncbi:MAG: DUF2089 domain-containing protein [Chloroflexi bacterium]|nr:DUF2089 domain-containing protein [Chloroflexota bacterium]
MNQLPNNCPFCQGNVIVTRFFCPDCKTSIEGRFAIAQSPFQNVTSEQMNFMLTFVRTEGRLNRMEEILGLSYPTIKNRLANLIEVLGSIPGEILSKPTETQRRQILDDIEAGRINVNQALRYLNGEDKYE